MADALAASVADLLLGLTLGSTGPGASNRLSIEGLTLRAGNDGALELEAASVELHDVKVHGPVVLPAQAATGGSWSLAPLASADGTIRAQIVDAHLVFDADVTVPIRQGQIDFGDATVEHVGPDSRMGISRMGLYVDAPNGRSYLYQFSAAPLAGVEFEERGALLGRVSDRGSLRLQEFAEGVLLQGPSGAGQGFTAQTRQLLDRTALSGEVRLGDGKVAAPGAQAELVGRAQGRNTIRLHSEAVGRGIGAELAALSVQDAALDAMGLQARCKEITGSVVLRLSVEGGQLQFALDIAELKISGLHLRRP
ncbi:MAG TPA: hypothetical protein VF522_14195 [Ramlibacter sp.]|uniref:hypothetical protein n=1 Tax=Ramlibacter sp. TaxID=1917967 RepID=UPI002ED090E5